MAGAPPLTWLIGPPRVPMSTSLYVWCFTLGACDGLFCAASRAGIASAANKVIAVIEVNILDFMVFSFLVLIVKSGARVVSANCTSFPPLRPAARGQSHGRYRR